jgi:hypothetical protein
MAVTFDGGETWIEVKTNTDEHFAKVRLLDGRGLVLGFHNLYEISLPSNKGATGVEGRP